MAHQLPPHWTQNPRISHRRIPPAWYHRYPGPFYTPKPSARMEKKAAEERMREWQSPAYDEESCMEATFWPCGIYSRIYARVRAALGGWSVQNIPDVGFINGDCARFVLCLPFYGFLISRLQWIVRSMYNIDGSDGDDLFDGCCCPGRTLARNEAEIVFRERGRCQLHELADAATFSGRGYEPELPMTYGKPGHPSPSHADRTVAVPDTKAGRKVASDIKARAGQSSQGSRPSNLAHSLGQDKCRVPTDNRTRPQKPESAAPAVSGRYSLTHDQLVATGLPDTAHDLELPSSTHHETQASEHLLHRDALVPSGPSLALHPLDKDAVTARPAAASRHGLADDQAVQAGTASSSHPLKDDAAYTAKQAHMAHALDTDASFADKGAHKAHALEADEAVIAAKQAPKAHALETDEAAIAPGSRPTQPS